MNQINIHVGKLGVFVAYCLLVIITAPIWAPIDGMTWLLKKAKKVILNIESKG